MNRVLGARETGELDPGVGIVAASGGNAGERPMCPPTRDCQTGQHRNRESGRDQHGEGPGDQRARYSRQLTGVSDGSAEYQ